VIPSLEDIEPNLMVKGVLLLLHVAGLAVSTANRWTEALETAIYEAEERLGAWG
jgi:hypothetical protein